MKDTKQLFLVKGFQFNGIHSGIKKLSRLDLGLIYSKQKAIASAIFTKNTMAAAPIQVSKNHIKNGKLHAIIINSGNANCFTGDVGLKHANNITNIIAKHFSIKKTEVLVASTGIIGKILPFVKMEKSIPTLIGGLGENTKNFASSILTTDTVTKEFHQEIKLSSGTIRISGYAKGSGMISPNMATMLAFLVTDADISEKLLSHALKQANEKSFNAITVDGCMSTNDMVCIMANGMASNKKITLKNSPDFNLFYQALETIMMNLAKMIVHDGEGAKNFIEVKVDGVKDNKDAKKIAMAIANSNLVKTANYGDKLNLGRAIAAIGSISSVKLQEKDIQIQHKIYKDKKILIQVFCNIGGGGSFTAYTCDLTEKYISINNNYS